MTHNGSLRVASGDDINSDASGYYPTSGNNTAPISDRAAWDAIEMTGDPRSIVDSLIAEHGLDGAIQAAMQMTATVNDNYALSVMRDVKRMLRERKAEA